MSRFIFFALLFCFIFFWFKRKFKGFSAKQAPSQSSASGELMVQCDTCQLHIPASDAFIHDQKPYCCEAHAK